MSVSLNPLSVSFEGDGVTARWRLEDKSVNGVFVNDLRITSKELVDGDVIVFGGGTKVAVPLSVSNCVRT